jgi:hypothetical protein
VDSNTTGWNYDEQGPQRDGEGTFAGMRGNDGVAPIPAVRGATIEPLESTLKSHSGHAGRWAGRRRSGPSHPASTRKSPSRRVGVEPPWNMPVEPLLCTYSPLRGDRRLSQFVEQRPGLFEVGGVEAFGEPGVDRGEEGDRLSLTALLLA